MAQGEMAQSERDDALERVLQEALLATLARMEQHAVQSHGYEALECGAVAKHKRAWSAESLLRFDALTQRMMDLGAPPSFDEARAPEPFDGGLAAGHEADLASGRQLVALLERGVVLATEANDAPTRELLGEQRQHESERLAWLEAELRTLEALGEEDYVESRRE